jgi:hypothetical protein
LRLPIVPVRVLAKSLAPRLALMVSAQVRGLEPSA